MERQSKKTTKKDSFSNGFDYDSGIYLPIAKRIVASTTIRQDLVSVQPIDGMDSGTRERIRAEVKSENRNRKIDSVLEGKPFEQMKIEEHPEYKGGPSSILYYIDYKYGTASSSSV